MSRALGAAAAMNPDRAARAQVCLKDPLYYIFTSGTTGLPKAALMSHLRFLNAGGVTAGLLELTRADVLYNVLPLYHGAGGMVVVSAALHVGIPIVLKRKFSAANLGGRAPAPGDRLVLHRRALPLPAQPAAPGR